MLCPLFSFSVRALFVWTNIIFFRQFLVWKLQTEHCNSSQQAPFTVAELKMSFWIREYSRRSMNSFRAMLAAGRETFGVKMHVQISLAELIRSQKSSVSLVFIKLGFITSLLLTCIRIRSGSLQPSFSFSARNFLFSLFSLPSCTGRSSFSCSFFSLCLPFWEAETIVLISYHIRSMSWYGTLPFN